MTPVLVHAVVYHFLFDLKESVGFVLHGG
jgi:hypothetical protein